MPDWNTIAHGKENSFGFYFRRWLLNWKIYPSWKLSTMQYLQESGIVIMCNMAPSWNQLQIILANILEVPISSRNEHYLLMAQDYYASHSLIKSKSQTSSSYCYPDLAYQRFYTLNKDVFLNAIFWLKLWMRGIYLCALWESLLHCIIKLCTNFNRAKLKLPCEMPW